MSILSSAQKEPGPSDNHPDYRMAFVRDAHRLIARGFRRIKPEEQSETEEESITEKLVAAINALVQAEDAEPWMDRYHAADDLRLPFPGREGKGRPRVDIEIIHVRPGRRPRFHFEAKRLGRSHAVGEYVGPEGLGCILNGEYARDSDDAGMIGYVQSETCPRWAEKIRKKLWKNSRDYSLLEGKTWEALGIFGELESVYRTRHARPAVQRDVDVYHTLLLCCNPDKMGT